MATNLIGIPKGISYIDWVDEDKNILRDESNIEIALHFRDYPQAKSSRTLGYIFQGPT